ncbi:CCA tRNA nucleotidyltransferase [Candidatus Parvarchaeota archaeon]|nr:CCA tRNA nucleotidyltransferase [Candidatus Parvarchaeota archaeon]
MGKVSRKGNGKKRASRTGGVLRHGKAAAGVLRARKAALGVIKSVLPKIIPSPQEQKRHELVAMEAIGRVTKCVPNNVSVVLAGSSAKGTQLAASTDIDVFILFPLYYQKHELMLLGLNYAKKAAAGTPWVIGYAEHPYLRTMLHGCKLDIVPSYKISDAREMTSSVDRSPLHTQYVNSRLTPAQKNEVRLLKQFMKNIGVYGAEVRVEGFSGYLCELLVIKYGSFLGVLEAASRWHNPTIDIEAHHGMHPSGEPKAREKYNSPLVVIDPVDRNRNVSAVVSATSLYRFVFAARRFLQKPSAKYFFAERVVHSKSRLLKIIGARKSEIMAFEFACPQLVPDILWPQLKKAALQLVKFLESQGFKVFGHYFWSDGKKCLVLVEMEVASLPAVRKAMGPAVYMHAQADDFIRMHKGSPDIHIEHERMVAIEQRKFTDALGASDYFMKNAAAMGVPSNLCKYIHMYSRLGVQKLLSPTYIFVAADYFTRRIV